MTSLEESVNKQFQDWTSNLKPTWEEWADAYIDGLVADMKTVKLLSSDQLGYDIAVTQMEKRLRGGN